MFKYLILLYALVLAPIASLYAEPSATGANAAEPPLTWIDPDTGHRVHRLTREPGSASLYFNENGYTPDGKRMIYTTPEGISLLDLESHQTRSVVKGKVRVIMMGHKTPTVYYIKPEENALYATQVDTDQTRKIAVLPKRGGIAAINADETFAAGTYIEGDGADYGGKREGQSHPLDQPKNKGQMMEERLAARLPLVLFTVDLSTGKVNPILHSTDWVNHLLFSPTDPKLLMYCHEGPWQKVDRLWTIHTDGSANTLLHQRTMAMEIAGHEFWSADGKTVWYDLQMPKGQVFFVAGRNLETGERTWYHLERNEWSIHFNVSRDGTLFCGDGGDPGQVAKAPDGQWIYLFRPELIRSAGAITDGLIRPGIFRAERLVNMSKHNYKLEPNVSFTPDAKLVIFRSNMFGATYVFGVEVAKATEAESPR
ncbi:MAG TPA: oligogalacturonate lyase family protein [Opitutaceae bacterium]|nr:oligogalacturonate lyase family protein [Opitutaceae bacterium]